MLTAILLGLGLAMDAVAVAIAAGVAVPALRLVQALRLAAVFGGFQAIMPVLGWLGGMALAQWIDAWDHWLAAGLLVVIGVQMLVKSSDDEGPEASPFAWGTLLVAGLATSIDALAAGVTLASTGAAIVPAAATIGGITATCCLLAVGLAARMGSLGAFPAEKVGGLVLIGLGLKIAWTG